MASQSATPKAPQAEVITVSGSNDTARVGPYTDTARTKRNVSSTPDTIVPAKSGSTTLGSTRPVYAADRAKEIDSGEAVQTTSPRPASPSSWKPGRDPYKIDGMVGQGFFKNGGN